MAGWHHRLDGREFGWIPGVGDGQAGLACCSSWGLKESDMTKWLNWTECLSVLCIEVLLCWQHRSLQLLCLPLILILWSLCSVLPYLVIFFILRSILSDMRIATPAFFSSHLHGIYFSIFSLSVYMCLEVWSGFLTDSIYMGFVFVSIQSVCVFWLKHLILLHLK